MRDPQTAEPIDEEPQKPGFPEDLEEDPRTDEELEPDPEDDEEGDLIVSGEPE